MASGHHARTGSRVFEEGEQISFCDHQHARANAHAYDRHTDCITQLVKPLTKRFLCHVKHVAHSVRGHLHDLTSDVSTSYLYISGYNQALLCLSI